MYAQHRAFGGLRSGIVDDSLALASTLLLAQAALAAEYGLADRAEHFAGAFDDIGGEVAADQVAVMLE